MAESDVPCRGIGTIRYYCMHACVHKKVALVSASPVLKLC